MMIARDIGVNRRRHEQREYGADRHAEGNYDADGKAASCARTARENQRHHADHHRRGSHQNRSQTDGGRMLDRLAPAQTFIGLHVVGIVHHQDAVLGDQADQGEQAHLGIDVHRRHAEEQRDERADDRHRHRDHDHERVAQALELRGQHQEDDDAERRGPPVITLRVFRTSEQPPDELVEAVEDLIEPAAWKKNGGDGTIRAVQGALVVRTTPHVQGKVARFIAKVMPKATEEVTDED